MEKTPYSCAPAQRRLAAVPDTHPEGLDDLIGPAEMRPGELHERYPFPVPTPFSRSCQALGIPVSLAVSLVCERQLAARDLTTTTGLRLEHFDHAARHETPADGLSDLMSDYARMLIAMISGHSVAESVHGPAVVPARLESRLYGADVVRLDAGEIGIALCWELAAVVSGATMTEWALRTALKAVCYSSRAAGHDSATASTAR